MTTMDPETPEPGERIARSDADAVLAEVETLVDGMEQRVDLTPLDFPRRLLLTHAHPDDESIGTGATMARYAAEGALVTLVTCTLGEEGEVVAEDLAHHAVDEQDSLGHLRIEELAAACEALGVKDHRFLGGPGRWRDSGMMGTEANDRPHAFWQADLDEAVRELVAIIRETRPQVVVTYDDNGGYGHPDHIQTHRVTVRAFDAAGDPSYAPDLGEPWQPTKLYYTAIAKSFLQQSIDAFQEAGIDFFEGVQSVDDLPFGTPDELITTEVDARDHLDAKLAALRAHRSQISVDGPFFALADNVGIKTFGIEHFILVRGERPTGRETDLFDGI